MGLVFAGVPRGPCLFNLGSLSCMLFGLQQSYSCYERILLLISVKSTPYDH
jgi:hypothetical protein